MTAHTRSALFNVDPAKAQADLKKRLEEDARLRKWKQSQGLEAAPVEALPVQEVRGQLIRVPIMDSPAFEATHGFVFSHLKESPSGELIFVGKFVK